MVRESKVRAEIVYDRLVHPSSQHTRPRLVVDSSGGAIGLYRLREA